MYPIRVSSILMYPDDCMLPMPLEESTVLYSVSFEIGLGSIDNGHGVFTHAAITRTHMRGAAGAAAT